MGENPIKDIPSFKKIREDSKSISILVRGWPILRPLFKLFGADVVTIDDVIKKVDPIILLVDEVTSLPDEFNNLFSDHGWIMYGNMNVDIAKKAIEVGKAGHIKEAEDILVEFYSADEIESELKTMFAVQAFRNRMSLAEKALIDFKEGRYYASILVVISLLDGMVNEIQQRGFFNQDVDLTAWDSVAAHNNGLQKLVSVLSRSRTKTCTESIEIPYRHGIIHGMDLGYDNQLVAVKSWVALLATRDWALLAEHGQLGAPPPKPEKSFLETLHQLGELEKDKKAITEWNPRNIEIGSTLPKTGTPSDYENYSPEQKFVEFLTYWQKNNYGFMANCMSKQINRENKTLPRHIREHYSEKLLSEWQLYEVEDIAPGITDITVKVTIAEEGKKYNRLLQTRVIREDDQEFAVVREKPGSQWVLVTWHLSTVDKHDSNL